MHRRAKTNEEFIGCALDRPRLERQGDGDGRNVVRNTNKHCNGRGK